MKRGGSAVWKGGMRDGQGTVSTDSGAVKGLPYTWSMRFENVPGTNPEELIAAAHAGCFSMALSGELGKLGLAPERIETRATFNFERTEAGFTVTSIYLDTTAKVPKADNAKFQAAAEAAKKGCPVSRLLKAEITLSAKLL